MAAAGGGREQGQLLPAAQTGPSSAPGSWGHAQPDPAVRPPSASIFLPAGCSDRATTLAAPAAPSFLPPQPPPRCSICSLPAAGPVPASPAPELSTDKARDVVSDARGSAGQASSLPGGCQGSASLMGAVTQTMQEPREHMASWCGGCCCQVGTEMPALRASPRCHPLSMQLWPWVTPV